jgi:hypothetical protein
VGYALQILIVEDRDEDFAAFERVMGREDVLNPVFRCTDGDDAGDFL